MIYTCDTITSHKMAAWNNKEGHQRWRWKWEKNEENVRRGVMMHKNVVWIEIDDSYVCLMGNKWIGIDCSITITASSWWKRGTEWKKWRQKSTCLTYDFLMFPWCVFQISSIPIPFNGLQLACIENSPRESTMNYMKCTTIWLKKRWCATLRYLVS